MSLLDGLLGELMGNGAANPIIAGLAEKVGLPPELAHSALAALAQARSQPGDTVQAASDAAGVPQDVIQQLLGHLGGEGVLADLAS